MLRAFVLLAVVALAGCTTAPEPLPPEAPPLVPPRASDWPAGGAAECPPAQALRTTAAFRVEGAEDARPDLAENAVTVEANASAPRRPVVVWTWQHVAPGERADPLGRAAPAEAWRLADGSGRWLCASVNLRARDAATPVAAAPATLRLRFVPTEDLEPGEWRVVVNWVVGCPSCGEHPAGNATGTLRVP